MGLTLSPRNWEKALLQSWDGEIIPIFNNHFELFIKEMWLEIQRRTPVDTGRARMSWYVTEGSRYTGFHPGPYPFEPATGPSQRRLDAPPLSVVRAPFKTNFLMRKIKPKSKVPDVVWISNSVLNPDGDGYILPLEFGSSKQAPSGMVRLAIIDVLRRGPKIFQQAKRSHRSVASNFVEQFDLGTAGPRSFTTSRD